MQIIVIQVEMPDDVEKMKELIDSVNAIAGPKQVTMLENDGWGHMVPKSDKTFPL